MARRKRPEADSPAVGVLGPFRRTPEAWRALGGPPCLWEVRPAVLAWNRCAREGYRAEFVYVHVLDALRGGPPSEDPETVPGALEFIARRWWRVACPYFLMTVDALTGEERQKIERWPLLYKLGDHVVDVAGVDRELFGRCGVADELRGVRS